MCADKDRVNMQRQGQRQHGVHRAWCEGDHDVGEFHMRGERHDPTKIAETAMATANEPSAALMWPASVLIRIRAKRLPIRAPMPTSATPRTHAGRPPSTSLRHAARLSRSSRRTSSSPEI